MGLWRKESAGYIYESKKTYIKQTEKYGCCRQMLGVGSQGRGYLVFLFGDVCVSRNVPLSREGMFIV